MNHPLFAFAILFAVGAFGFYCGMQANENMRSREAPAQIEGE